MAAEYVPAAQGVHADVKPGLAPVPIVEKVPGEHGEHEPEPAIAYEPAAQGVHAEVVPGFAPPCVE